MTGDLSLASTHLHVARPVPRPGLPQARGALTPRSARPSAWSSLGGRLTGEKGQVFFPPPGPCWLGRESETVGWERVKKWGGPWDGQARGKLKSSFFCHVAKSNRSSRMSDSICVRSSRNLSGRECGHLALFKSFLTQGCFHFKHTAQGLGDRFLVQQLLSDSGCCFGNGFNLVSYTPTSRRNRGAPSGGSGGPGCLFSLSHFRF